MQSSLTGTIGRGTFWYSVNSFLTKAIGLVTMFFVLRTLSVYEYGLVELALAGVAALSIFRLPGLSGVILSDMARAKGEGNVSHAKGLFLSYGKTQLVLGFLATVFVFTTAGFIASFYEGQITFLIKIAAFTFFLSAIRTSYTILFAFSLRFFTQSMHTFFEETSKLAFVLICVVYLQMGTVGLVLATALSQAVTLLILFPFARHAYQPFRKVVAKDVSLPAIIRGHGKWSIATGYANDFSQTIRVWLLRVFVGTEAVGLFAAAQGIVGHTVGLISLNQVMTPIIPQYFHDKEQLKKIVAAGIKYQFLAYAVLGVIAWFLFPPILSYFFPNYIPAMPLFRIMLFSLAGVSVATMLTPVFYAAKAQRSYLESIIVKILSTLMFIPVFVGGGFWLGGFKWGLYGAAFEYVVTVTITTLERFWAVRRIVPTFKDIHKHFFSFDKYDKMVLSKFQVLFKKK